MAKAVIFDMDGLLIDSEPVWRSVEIQIFGSVGVTLTDEDCIETAGWRLDRVIDHWFSKNPWQNKLKNQIQLEIYDAMENAIQTSVQLLPFALDSIQYVRTKGLKAALATSSPTRLIEAMVARFSLQNTFDVLQSAELEPQGKPDPAVYLTAATKLSLAPTECIAVEDSPIGVASAKSAGMMCIGVPHRHANLNEFMDADIVIDSLKSFPRALERMID